MPRRVLERLGWATKEERREQPVVQEEEEEEEEVERRAGQRDPRARVLSARVVAAVAAVAAAVASGVAAVAAVAHVSVVVTVAVYRTQPTMEVGIAYHVFHMIYCAKTWSVNDALHGPPRQRTGRDTGEWQLQGGESTGQGWRRALARRTAAPTTVTRRDRGEGRRHHEVDAMRRGKER